MKVDQQAQGQVTLVTGHGPLISEELADFRRVVQEATAAQARGVVADMHDIPYVDSAGIEVLLELAGLHISSLRRPKLAGLTETCLEALELTDILPRLEVFDTVENAIKSCQR